MYATEYDLIIAEDRLRDRRHEMQAIRAAQQIQAASATPPSLLDRLMLLTSRATQAPAPQGKAGATA